MSSNWTPDNLTKTNALFNFSFQQTRYFLLVISLNWVKNVITYINILLGYRKLFTIWILKINWRKVSKTRGSWRTERRKKWQIHSYRREFDLMKAHSTYRSRKNWIRENNNDKYMDLPFDLSIVFDFEENVCQSICRWKHSTHAYKFTICVCSLSQKKKHFNIELTVATSFSFVLSIKGTFRCSPLDCFVCFSALALSF